MPTDNKLLADVLESDFVSAAAALENLKAGLKHNANCTGAHYVDLDPIITNLQKFLDLIKTFCEYSRPHKITVTIWRGLIDGVEGVPAGVELHINYYDLDLDPDAENVEEDADLGLFSHYIF